ncbi:hypothetical protein L581_0164 [Serratia fonticola AU-AP2C]|nr:hypothetical protein L581_0164 [Serratia fonticola AU-AP2C]
MPNSILLTWGGVVKYRRRLIRFGVQVKGKMRCVCGFY